VTGIARFSLARGVDRGQPTARPAGLDLRSTTPSEPRPPDRARPAPCLVAHLASHTDVESPAVASGTLAGSLHAKQVEWPSYDPTSGNDPADSTASRQACAPGAKKKRFPAAGGSKKVPMANDYQRLRRNGTGLGPVIGRAKTSAAI